MREKAWYVVQTSTGAEADVHLRLSRLNYPALLLSKVMMERKNGKAHEIVRLMLPGYVFVYSQMQAADWHTIRRLPEVLRILGGDRPSPLCDEECARILWLGNEGRPWGLSHGRYEGDALIVTDGPLAGREQEIVQVDMRTNRARIRTDILGESKGIDLGLIIEKQTAEQEG